MKLSFYKKHLKNTDWKFEFCLLLPTLTLFKSHDNIFQPNYLSNKISLPTNFIVDSSQNKCYIEIRILGFGISYHFYKTRSTNVTE